MKLLCWNGWAMQAPAFAPLARELPEAEIEIPTLIARRGETLNAWVARLAASVPQNALLLGWSLGALLALAAIAQGAKPRGLILIGATPRFVAGDDWPDGLPVETVDGFQNGFAQAPEKILRRFLALQGVGDRNQRNVLATLGNALADAATPDLAYGLEALANADLRADCAKIETPASLLIHGRNDVLMPHAAARWLAATLPKTELVTLEECGHAPHVSNPAAVAASIKAFWEKTRDAAR